MSDPSPMRNGFLHVVDNYDGDNTANPGNVYTRWSNTTTPISSSSSKRETTTTKQNPTTPQSATTAAVLNVPITLPDGRLIDGKNTLQSFDTAVVSSSPIAAMNSLPPPSAVVNVPFTLPDGRLMDGKNTLQSFDSAVVPSWHPVAATKSLPPPLEGNAIDTNPRFDDPTGTYAARNGGDVNRYNRNQNTKDTAIVPAEAVVVRSLALVDAELADSRVELVHPSKRGTSFWLAVAFAIALICLATVAGVYCGIGNCGGSISADVIDTKSNNSQDITIVSNMTQNPGTNSPTVSPPTVLSTSPSSVTVAPSSPSSNPSKTPNLSSIFPTISHKPTLSSRPTSVAIAPSTRTPFEKPPSSTIVISPAPTKNLVQTANAPAEQLMVACNFLLFTNLTECQTERSFEGTTWGTTIPTEIGWLTQLTRLDLSVNSFTGTIPSTIGNLQQLTYLNVSANLLTGTIPPTIGNLTLLRSLDLNSNILASTIPAALENLMQLTYLRLSSNSLSGTIPSSLGNLTQITDFILLYNRLTGTIPSSLGNLRQLNFFTVSYNQLVGTIPSTLGNLTELTYLGLDVNQLSGPIPSTLGNLIQLTDMNFGGNQFTGTIPLTLGKLTQLVFLFLYDNPQLRGTVPPSLCSASPRKYIGIDCDNQNITCSCCVEDVSGTPCQ